MKRARWSLPVVFALTACHSGPPPQGATVPAGMPPAVAVVPAAPGPDDWRNTRPGPGPLAEHEYPAVETARLKNGLSLYVVHKPGGVVALSVVARGGAGVVPAGKSGLAALTVRMMTEGTTKRNALALAEAVESMGTALEESAGRDYVRLGMTTLKDDLKPGLALLSEVAQKPAFAPAELERVRHEWLDSIEGERQSPGRLSALVGLRLLLGTTTGAPVNGARTDVAALKRADLLGYYSSNFVPGNVALIVAGDVTLDDVKPLAEKLFGSWSGTAKPQSPVSAAPTAPQTGKQVFVVDRPGAVQSAIFMVQPFPKRAEPGYEAREVLNDLFGGVFTSRLNMNLREAHAYTYGASSLDMSTRGWGAFAVMSSVRTDVTGAALAEAITEIQNVRDPSLKHPIQDSEVALARVDLEQHLGATLSDVEDVASRVEDLFIDGLPVDYFRKYPAILDGVTSAVAAAESQKLDPSKAVIVVVGDKAAIAGQLAQQGFVVETAPDALSD